MMQNETIDVLMRRHSTRAFRDRPIPEEDIRTLLRAAMAAPTAVNARDWSFVAVTERDTLCSMAEANGPAANPLRSASLGILVCGDLSRTCPKAPDYWIIDGAIAAENMAIAAEALGIGCVWLGTWPQSAKVEAQAKLFSLPDHIRPHSILAFGYAADEQPRPKVQRPEWEADRVHFEKW